MNRISARVVGTVSGHFVLIRFSSRVTGGQAVRRYVV